MKFPKGQPVHSVAPKEWHHTPNITGDHEFDASIMHTSCKRVLRDLPHHIKNDSAYLNVVGGGSVTEGSIVQDKTAYRARSNYRGGAYNGYQSDD
jgi:sugar (pentulose or hexulose) kinase